MATAFVIDDTELSRTGLQLVLESRKVRVLGTGAPVTALNRIPALKPDVVLLRDCDAHLSVMCSLAEKMPEQNFLMLTGSPSCDVNLMDALAAGADGVADGTVTVDTLVMALETVAAGHMWIEAAAAQSMRDRIAASTPSGPLAALPEQQQQVAAALARGLSNREIAAEMFVAEKTVKNYVSRILQHLGVSNRSQAGLLVRDLQDGLDPAAQG